MDEDMNQQNVSNWMLYELIRDFKNDMNNRFTSVESEIQKNREAIDKNAQAIDKNRLAIEQNGQAIERNRQAIELNRDAINKNRQAIDKNHEGIEGNRKRIDNLYDHRHELTVKFTRTWAGVSFFIATMAALFSSFIIKLTL